MPIIIKWRNYYSFRYDPIADVQEGGLGYISSGDTASDRSTNPGSSPNIELGVCPGCLSMYCRACARAQGEALQQVEGLLARLEAAEALYPSSQAFAANYPLYKSAEFTDRVKAMCLWYNMTKHHRLKIHILGRLLMMLHGKKKQEEATDSGIRYANLIQRFTKIYEIEILFYQYASVIEIVEWILLHLIEKRYFNFLCESFDNRLFLSLVRDPQIPLILRSSDNARCDLKYLNRTKPPPVPPIAITATIPRSEAYRLYRNHCRLPPRLRSHTLRTKESID